MLFIGVICIDWILCATGYGFIVKGGMDWLNFSIFFFVNLLWVIVYTKLDKIIALLKAIKREDAL